MNATRDVTAVDGDLTRAATRLGYLGAGHDPRRDTIAGTIDRLLDERLTLTQVG